MNEISQVSTPMNCYPRRTRLRALLEGDRCVYPASVFDPISARIADDLGFESAMFAGSIASYTILGAPDLVLITLSELAEQAHRICRASDIPLIVDADHGYGNALNVRRTIEELETAGVSGITIEDTDLPVALGSTSKGLISTDDMLMKLEAALAARQDDSLSIFARTTAFVAASADEALARIGRYAATGVDGVFLVGISEWSQLEAVRACTSIPLLLGSTPAQMKDPVRLAGLGVVIALEGHAPFKAAVEATYKQLKKMRDVAQPSSTATADAPPDLMNRVLRVDQYRAWS